MNELRIPYAQLLETFEKVLLLWGFDLAKARLSAALFAKTSLDGVASHGLNRFPTYIKMIEQGYIIPSAEPALQAAFGPFERWDGKLGPGNTNAFSAMERAISLALEQGMGCVALSNTNHWMRGGNFGWQAVDSGCIGICFTNTKPNMPAWGGSEPALGNNPLVVAIPRNKGAVVLDMAMSQFSYGKISNYLKAQQPLPFDGGFDAHGNLSRDPAQILENELALPIGLWKGAGLSLVLDMLASVLAQGLATHKIGAQKAESGLSQVFLCFNLTKLGIADLSNTQLDAIVSQLKASATFAGKEVLYPGERTGNTRTENLTMGVPVDTDIWEAVLQYLA